MTLGSLLMTDRSRKGRPSLVAGFGTPVGDRLTQREIRRVELPRMMVVIVAEVASNFETVMTRRLVLRVLRTADADDLFAITSDPQTWEHAPSGRHMSTQTTLDWIMRARELWARDGLSFWLVRLQVTDEVLGVGGVQRQKSGNWNLHYRFAPRAWGNGFATELGMAALEAAHSHDGDVAVIAWVLPNNVASQRVAERLGMTNQGLHIDPSDGLARLAYTDRVIDFS
jgi:RimJ/RimL family protein N-acetyltransferase